MKCRQLEEKIALYVEGDLGERAASEVQEHLRGCAACRDLAAGLSESQAALRSLRAEEIDDAALTEVRRRVLGQIGSQKPSWLYAWRWQHALGGAMAVAVAAFLLWPRQEVPPPQSPPAPVAVVERPPEAAPVKPPVAKPKPKAPATQVARREPRPAEPSRVQAANPASREPLVVKLLTDDPNIVIVWLIDQNGDGT